MSPLVRPLSVLIVDESAMLRAMLKRVIQIAGVPIERVLEAPTAVGGEAALAVHAVDVVFANVDAAQQQGCALFREMQNRREWQAVLRVATSTRGLAADHALAALGVRGHLSTPFRPEAVRDVMAPLLRSDAALER